MDLSRTAYEDEIWRLLQNPLSPDDTFNFHCTGCGECCKHREDITLTPFDLVRIAKYLDIRVEEVFTKYCVFHVGKTSNMPVVSLNMQGLEKICPFLEERKCKIHNAKPTVCTLYPLGRVGGGTRKILYILQDVKCGSKDKVHTVREWLADIGLEESETWFQEYGNTFIPIGLRIGTLKTKLSPKTIETLENALLVIIYLRYEREEEFLPQYNQNIREADILISVVENMYK